MPVLQTADKMNRWGLKSITVSNDQELRNAAFSSFDIIYIRGTIVLTRPLTISRSCTFIGEGGSVLRGQGLIIQAAVSLQNLTLKSCPIVIDGQVTGFSWTGGTTDDRLFCDGANTLTRSCIEDVSFTSIPTALSSLQLIECTLRGLKGEIEFSLGDASAQNTIVGWNLVGGFIYTYEGFGQNAIAGISAPLGITESIRPHPTDSVVYETHKFHQAEDAFLGNTGWGMGWFAATLGTGSVVAATGGFGGVSLGGSIAGDLSVIHLGLSSIRLAASEAFYARWFCDPVQLSTALNEFVLRFGFLDTAGLGDVVDGVYFEYNRLASTNWLLKTADNSVRTTTVSTQLVQTGLRRFDILVLPTEARFYIQGVLMGSIATNVPRTRDTSAGAKLDISTGAVARSATFKEFRLARAL